MNVEWVSPAIAGIVGVVGIAATFLTARGGRRQAERMDNQNRKQQRFAAAYVELLMLTERFGRWATGLAESWTTSTVPPQPLPSVPADDEQMRVKALVSAYGSSNVRALCHEYFEHIQKIESAARRIEYRFHALGKGEVETDAAGQGSYWKVWEEIREVLVPGEKVNRKAVASAVSLELNR